VSYEFMVAVGKTVELWFMVVELHNASNTHQIRHPFPSSRSRTWSDDSVFEAQGFKELLNHTEELRRTLFSDDVGVPLVTRISGLVESLVAR
jgi:hypothetical protein